MKFAFSNVRRRPDANTAYTSFFFNARGDELEKSTAGLHRSLLLQVLERFPDLQSVLDDPLLVPRNQTSCPNNEVLRDLFRDAVMNLGQRRLICFVDALDECDEEQVREMVTYFEDLADEATTGGIQLQICFSSRHYPHIEIQNGLKFTLEDQPGHEQDLEKYVRNCLRVGKRSDAEEIKAGILEKANGVFMWVVLVVDILNKEYGRGRISAARKKLSEIPSRLSDLFKDILRRDNENMDDLLLCIQWILYAKRPLTREEFYFAMLSGMPSEDLATYDPERITSEDLDLFVISSSKGLAEITKSKNATIQFIHESVRDFLIKDNGLQSLWPQLGGQFQNLSHDKLKECCHSYMNFATLNARTAQNSEALPKANSNEAKELRRKTLADFPFLDYATEYVLHHGDLGAIAVSQLGFLDQFPLQAWIQFTNILEKHEVRRYTPTADLTYILAERNLVRLLEARMETNPHVHVAGERYGFPMLAALANGHLLAAKTLLGQAAGSQNIEDLFTSLDNMKSWSFRRRQGPLHWAIENRQEALAVSLIDSNNIDLSMKDAKRRTALHWAAIFGDESTMKFLLEKMFGPHGQNNVIETMSQPQVAQRSSVAASKAHAERTENINALDHNKKSPLSLAAENGHEAIVRMLLMWGASINTSHTTDSTGLYSAAYSGHTDIVKLLIENGAAVDYIDYNGRTALYAAARSGHTDIVKLLIKNGAAVDHTDSDRWMALHAAARSGHTDIVKLLIKNGAPVDYTDHNSRTPLDTAAGSGHTEIVKLLIENGAAVGHTGHYGRTALHAAAGSGHTDIVKLLIKNGAPVDYTDHNSRTPLDTAAGSGHTDIVKLLIENGAAVGRTGHYGNMALHDAARDGHTDIVKLLIIKNRAAVGHTYHNGKTALHAAARSGHTDTVKLLIENGAAVNHTGHYGNMALHDAARDGHTAVVKILLASGAQIFINKKGWRGRTALHQAVQHGHIATITTLLNNGATIDSTNDCGETPLSTATSFRHDAVVALLKSKAVDASLSAVGAGS
ncbi:PFS domain-containing protein [Colletotrichum tofieldiae]|nr:PFS domain-containing protein [Colletotrichum tofieldiae]